MVMPNAPNAIRSLVDGVLAPRGISLDVIAEVGAVQTVLALVTAGVGYTILPESALLTRVEAKVSSERADRPTCDLEFACAGRFRAPGQAVG